MNLLTCWKGRALPFAIALSLAVPALAQTPYPFQMQYTDSGLTTQVANGTLLTLSAPLGQSQMLTIRATYIGTGTVTIPAQPVIAGAAAFTAAFNGPLPQTVNPGESVFFTIRYAPSVPFTVTARMTLGFIETPASTLDPITISLQGVTSALVVSYTLPEDNNVVPLIEGGTIPFPQTVVGATSTAALGITNIGSTLGQVTRITISGAAFRLQGLPLLPANVQSGQTIQVQVVYRPTATGPHTGTVIVETTGGPPVVVQLQGTAIAPRLGYQWGDPPVEIQPGGTITLSANPGQSTSTTVRVTNSGTASTTVTAISAAGTGFQTTTPVLPQTVAPGGALTFTVTFTPARTGEQTGTLTINGEVFNLVGNGLGSQLTYSYTAGSNTVNLGTGGAIIFSPVRVTESAQVRVEIRNAGTSAATILNLGIGQTNTPYTIPVPPALPATIPAGGVLSFNVRFEPVALGFSSSTLVVDSVSLPLTGSGTAPPALPAYTLSGPSGTVQPLTQPTVGLRLASPYPVALTGTLTLTPATGALPSDPAVQFATGGRTATFRIPANSTDAIFGVQGTQLGLQTGTVAGSVVLTPTFATLAGNLDLTPATPVTSQFTIAPAAPVLISVQATSTGSTSFNLLINGFTTPRALNTLTIELTPASGYRLPTSRYTVDVKSIAAAWFQSPASQAFGGQFRVTIPFTFQLSASQIAAGQSALGGIAAVSVTAVNDSGTSAPLRVELQ